MKEKGNNDMSNTIELLTGDKNPEFEALGIQVCDNMHRRNYRLEFHNSQKPARPVSITYRILN